MLPHTPSRYTGTMGHRTPDAIRSSPRLNLSRFPVRLIDPSAKMQTTWPRPISRPAISNDCAISSGESLAATGIACIMRKNQLSPFHS